MAADAGNEAPARAEVLAALERVTRSALFLRSSQLQRLLRYLVEETLAGRAERLKEFVIGVEVFGRPSSFDSAHRLTGPRRGPPPSRRARRVLRR